MCCVVPYVLVWRGALTSILVQSTWESKLKLSWPVLAEQRTSVEFNVNLNLVATTADRWVQNGSVEEGGMVLLPSD